MSRKFLGFVVRHRGIKIDPAKIEVIRDMPPTKEAQGASSLASALSIH